MEPRNNKRRCRRACKQCRQAKVRCGMVSAPCSRCQLHKLECEWDPTFKSVRTNERVSRLEFQLQRLQDSKDSRNSLTTDNGSASSMPAMQPLSPPLLLHEVNPNNRADTTTNHYTIDSIELTLTHQDADELFAIYFRKFHLHLPFLDPDLIPKDYFDSCNLLFWTVIAVAARVKAPQEDLLTRLAPYLNESISSIITASGFKQVGLGHMQALVLLALWPPHGVPFCGDRCMMLANLALTSAINSGYHNPRHGHEYDRTKSIISPIQLAMQARIWATCVAIIQNMSIDLGTPALVPFNNWKITELCDTSLLYNDPTGAEIPIDLVHYLVIERIGYAFYTTLPERADTKYSDNVLLEMLSSAELNAVQAVRGLSKSKALQDHDSRGLETANANTPGTELSLLNEMRYLGMLLHIRSMVFTLDATNISRHAGILRAYQTAVELLSLAISEEAAKNIILYSPRMTSRILFHAACVLFLVLNSSLRGHVDYRAGKVLASAIEMSFRLQKANLVKQVELSFRYADILRGLWQVYESDTVLLSEEAPLKVHTRFSSSVVYHCLALFYERFSRHVDLDLPREDHNSHTGVSDIAGTKPISNQDENLESELDAFQIDKFWLDGFNENELFNIF